MKLDLKTDPLKEDSVKFSAHFNVFDCGTPEQWCRWRDDLTKVFKGLDLANGPNQIGMARHLLSGQAQDIFDQHFEDNGVNKSVTEVNNALKKVARAFFPDSAVTNQMQWRVALVIGTE